MSHWILAQSRWFGRATRRLAEDTRGVTMLEYGLIAALVAAVCVGAVTTLGTDLSDAFTSIASSL